MVYNALKLFMEINPELFDESMQQYKQRKIECVLRQRKTFQGLTYLLGNDNTLFNVTRLGKECEKRH